LTRKKETMHDILEQLEAKRELARLGGGEKRIDAQHKKASSRPVSAGAAAGRRHV
jgi:hypothetical protein